MAATIFWYDNAGNGLGTLPYDGATHDEALDGTDKLTVTSRVNPAKRDKLVWMDDGGAYHEHIVDATRRTHAGKGARTEITCSNSVSELFGVLAQGTRLHASAQDIMSTLLSGTRWGVGACDDFGVVEIEVYHKSVRECIAELCELVGGELETEINVGTSGVVSRAARIVRERGNKAIVRQFQYGRNISSIFREVAPDEVYTAVKGYGAKLREDDDSEFPARLEVSVESTADLERWGVPNGDGTYSHNYTTYTDSQCTDRQFLLKQCRSVLDSVSRPLVRYEFDSADVGGDLWSDVRLGDRVMCVDELFNPPLELIERVSQVRRNLRGRIQCRIAIGARANPMLDQYKSNNKISRVSTGNTPRISSYTPINTGGAGYDGEGAPTIGDADGSPVTEPTSIAVVTPPTKTEYYSGERIDYSGIQVALYNSDGSAYTDDWHPDGMASFDELSFPVQFATSESETKTKYSTSDLETTFPQPIPSYSKIVFEVQLRNNQCFREETTVDGDVALLVSHNGAYYETGFRNSYTIASPRTGVVGKRIYTSWYVGGSKTTTTYDVVVSGNNSFTHADKTVYMEQSDYVTGGNTTIVEAVPAISETQDVERPPEAWTAVYGDFSYASSDTVPVNWTRSDGAILESSFGITIIEGKADKKSWAGDEGGVDYIWGDPSILYPELYQ